MLIISVSIPVPDVYLLCMLSLVPSPHPNQVLDLRQVELVYGSSFFKSIETGGNVSRALVRLEMVPSLSDFQLNHSCH